MSGVISPESAARHASILKLLADGVLRSAMEITDAIYTVPLPGRPPYAEVDLFRRLLTRMERDGELERGPSRGRWKTATFTIATSKAVAS